MTLAVFSPDGKRVATASNDSTARVWLAATSESVTPPLRHQELLNAVAFSRDGRRVVTCSADKTARIWDAATGQPVGAPLTHQGMVLEATFSPDGRMVATLSEEKTARVWDADTGRPVGRPLRLSGDATAIAFSLDGRDVLILADKSSETLTVLLGVDSTDRVERLADLAELMAGGRVSNLGSFVALDSADRQQRVRRLGGPDLPLFPPVEVLVRAITGRRR